MLKAVPARQSGAVGTAFSRTSLMTSADRPGHLVTTATLDARYLPDVMALVETCAAHDGFDAGADEGFVRARSYPVPPEIARQTADLIWMVGDRVVGYSGTYGFGRDEIEVVAVVHPEWRRRGIGLSLINEAIDVGQRAEVSRVLLVVPRFSVGGQALAERVGAKRSHSEAAMVLRDVPPGGDDLGLGLVAKIANISDVAVLGEIGSSAFGGNPEEASAISRSSIGAIGRTIFLIAKGGENVGMVSIAVDHGAASIAGFAVRPEHQGQGIGRAVLKWLVRRLHGDGIAPITIEVDVTNDRAAGLYRDCGFREDRIYDYLAAAIG